MEIAEKAASEEEDLTEDLVKCTRQLAQIAEKNVKFHSNLLKEDQSTAENVIRSIRNSRTQTEF